MSTTMRRLALLAGSFVLAFAISVTTLSILKHESPVEVLTQPIIPSPQQAFGKDHLLVLVVGLDYDYDNLDNETSKASRSDVIKVINLDFRTKKAYILSVPRDMDAVLPNGKEAKINQAQSDGGIKESQAVIAKWLGVPGFDRYVVLRIDSMKDLINAVGGIDVAVMNSDALKKQGANGPIDYDDNWGHLHVHLKPGLQHLNGETAVGYARFRHDWCSDPCRIMRQDQVVTAIVNRLKSDKLNTLASITSLVGVMRRDVETSLTAGEELSIANAFSSMSPGAVKSAQVPYVGDKNVPDYGNVIIPDVAARAKLVQDMLIDPPAPSAQPNLAVVTSVPAAIRVEVQNGTSTAGLAKRVAALLKARGFTVGSVGNAAHKNVATTQLETSDPAAGAQVRAALGSAIREAPVVVGTSPTVTIIAGQDLATALNTEASAAQ